MGEQGPVGATPPPHFLGAPRLWLGGWMLRFLAALQGMTVLDSAEVSQFISLPIPSVTGMLAGKEASRHTNRF